MCQSYNGYILLVSFFLIDMTINDIPKNYPLCIVKDCPMANSCLLQLAMQVQNTKQRLLTIVNPKCITASGLISMLMLKDITGMTKQKIVISML